MHRRISDSRRPSGTDGSDYSYRMVVDSRYQKVATKKKVLAKLIFIQAIFQLVGLPYLFVSATKQESFDVLPAASAAVGFISLILGELGRRRSRVNLLRLYILGTSISLLLSIFGIFRSKSMLEIIENSSEWKSNFEVQEALRVSVGLFVQLFVIGSVITLISNMSPSKRAS